MPIETLPPDPSLDAAVFAGLRAVVEHLRMEGFDARAGDGCAYLGLHQVAVLVVQSQFQRSPGGRRFQANLQVALRLYDDRPLLFHDLVCGVGDSPEDACVRGLLEVWRHGTLPPLLPLLGGKKPDDVEVIGKDDPRYTPPWVVYAGPYHGFEDEADAVRRELLLRPPLLTVRPVLADLPKRTTFHWVNLYRYRNAASGLDIADCMVDGYPLPAGVEAMLSWQWPELPGRLQYRQFLVLIPEDRA